MASSTMQLIVAMSVAAVVGGGMARARIAWRNWREASVKLTNARRIVSRETTRTATLVFLVLFVAYALSQRH